MKTILGAICITSTIITNITSINFKNVNKAQSITLEQVCQVKDNKQIISISNKNTDLVRIVKNNLNLDSSFDKILKQCAIYLSQKSVDVFEYKQKLEQIANLELSKFNDVFNVKNFIKNNVLSRSTNYLINKQIASTQTKRNVVHFLMQLKLLYGDRVINQSVNQINWLGTELPEGAGFFSVNKHPYVTSLSLLYKDVFNLDYIEQAYNKNMTTLISDIYILTHEYGHALSIYAGLTAMQKNTINKHNNVIDAKPLSDRDINSTIIMKNNASNRLAKWLEKRLNFNNVQDNAIMLSLMTPSQYGQPRWESKYFRQDASFIEWFAELFAYWMLTPKQDYSIRWQIVNEFFINILPRMI